ncbi:MAG: indole-3-glycerol phosphate synthase TrpC, partial [Methanoregula sp.]
MILDEIVNRTKKRVERLPDTFPEPNGFSRTSLEAAIRSSEQKNPVIAEIKCASPSGGIIRRNVDMGMMAGVLANHGCVGISVLTEPYFFGGSGADIARVKKAVGVPVLRKDFVIDLRQIPETKALGADAVLLIAAVLKGRLPEFVDAVYNAGLEPLVEVHTATEIDCALATNAQMI